MRRSEIRPRRWGQVVGILVLEVVDQAKGFGEFRSGNGVMNVGLYSNPVNFGFRVLVAQSRILGAL